MSNNTTFIVVAIVAALALFGAVAITIASIPSVQEAKQDVKEPSPIPP
jgi:hypothetical protein